MRTTLVFLLLAAACSASIVTNGGFEQTNIGNTLYVFVPAGGTSITGWTVTAPSSGQGVDLISNRTGCVGCAYTGQQSVDMAGSPGPGSIYQDLSTVAGTYYRLTYFLSSNGGPFGSSLTVLWGGASVATENSPALGTWNMKEYILLATGSNTRLEFQGNIGGNAGAYLDDVSVTEYNAIPEPGSMALMGAGLALVAVRFARRAA